MTDILHRMIADDGRFFGLSCDTTQLVNEACKKHDVGPTAAAVLGRALTGSLLLAALLKDGQYVQLKFEGSGPLGKIITEAGYDGWARGYVANPRADVPLNNGKIDVATGLGHAGFLTVTKHIGDNKKYQGLTQLFTSEIGEDIAYYLLESEQTPSVVALSVLLEPNGTIGAAGGFLIQALPPVDEDIIIKLEQQVQTLPPITEFLKSNQSPAEILNKLFTDIPHHPTASKELIYKCSCSRSKMESAVFSLGIEEIRNLLESEGGADVHCEFCRDSYWFDKDDLQTMINSGNSYHQ